MGEGRMKAIRHAEFSSASVRGEMLALYIKTLGEILKQVQDDSWL